MENNQFVQIKIRKKGQEKRFVFWSAWVLYKKTAFHFFSEGCFFAMEQATGIEPASVAWEATVLPMNYACGF